MTTQESTSPSNIIRLGFLYIKENNTPIELNEKEHTLLKSLDPTATGRTFTLEEQQLITTWSKNSIIKIIPTPILPEDLNMYPKLWTSLNPIGLSENLENILLKRENGSQFTVSTFSYAIYSLYSEKKTVGSIHETLKKEILNNSTSKEKEELAKELNSTNTTIDEYITAEILQSILSSFQNSTHSFETKPSEQNN